MTEQKKIGIAGIGNLLLRDEGFGVHVVHYLQNNYEFPDNVDIQDVGTAGIYMAPFLETCDPVLVIDVVDIAGEPGSFHFFTLDDVRAGTFQTRMSPHQLGLLEIYEVCKLRGAAPGEIEFYTVIPKELTETVESFDEGSARSSSVEEMSLELTDIVGARMVEVAEMILKRLKDLGVEVKKKDSLQE